MVIKKNSYEELDLLINLLKDYLENQERKNLMKIMVLSCGRKKAESYQFDHRRYIVDRMLELGICMHSSKK